jgi:hypothetical protein
MLPDDQTFAIAVARPLGVAMCDGFLNAILAGISTERPRTGTADHSGADDGRREVNPS